MNFKRNVNALLSDHLSKLEERFLSKPLDNYVDCCYSHGKIFGVRESIALINDYFKERDNNIDDEI